MKYGGLNLQSENIITESVQFRSMANRIINLAEISRRAGSKFLSTEFSSKNIVMTGHIKSTSNSGILSVVDTIHKYLALPEQSLEIVSGRSYTATCVKAEIPEMKYTQSIVPFKFEFVTASPFSIGASQIVGFTLPSGVYNKEIEITISGSAFAEPVIRLNTASGAGDSGITLFSIEHEEKGEEITISGTFSKGNELVFDYENAFVTFSGAVIDFLGAFSRFDVGVNNLNITLSGSNNFGVTGQIEYNPRYYQ